MCGIVGFFGHGDQALLDAMGAAIAHRGPDGEGSYLAPPVGLAMRRLAIIDPAGGQQPIGNEDGGVQLVFNGEIYNYRELKAAHLRDHTFTTASDTEVVVHLYEQFGEAAFAMLNGMFAFALWDAARGRLYLVRDRMGVKPLYVHTSARRVTFGSELKALLQDPAISRSLDPAALEAYLAWQYVPGPATLISGVRKLPPGCFMRLEEGAEPRLERFWSAADVREGPPRGDFEAVMRAAVHRQMVSDVPVGAFLSGGVDSSLVVALMRETAGDRLKTFTAGFKDARFDESAWAARVAAHLGVSNEVVLLDERALDAVPELAWHLDEPIADRAALPTLFLSRLAASQVKVVLTGEGSDELFAGYPRYRLERMAQRFHRLPFSEREALWRAVVQWVPAGWRAGAAKLLLSPADPALRRERWVSNFDPAARARLLAIDVPLSEPPALDDRSLGAQLRLDLRTWLVDDVLMKADKMTMAASLEARVPFLDNAVVDWALATPDPLKLRHGVGKAPVKAAAARLLPPGIAHRPKQAFHSPTAHWFRGVRGQVLLQESLLGETARARGLFQPREIEALIARHLGGEDVDQALWNLLILEWWQRAYLDRVPSLQAPC